MKYPDTIKLVTVTSDMYGDKTTSVVETVPATFIKRAGVTHSENREGETSDAAVYLQPIASVLDKRDELEGMYLHAEPFSAHSWYRISTVNIAQRKLLNNAVDNVYCRLDKIAGIANVRIS